jgi:MOSC domain-containing protein YiiM
MPDIQPSILSIQVGKAAPLGPSGVLSGFVKRIVRGPVVIAPLGLTGAEQADLSVHGGPDKAVYFYPSEHYATWAREFAERRGLFTPSGFGENLTTAGLIENTVAIGDIFSVGNALLQGHPAPSALLQAGDPLQRPAPRPRDAAEHMTRSRVYRDIALGSNR